MRWISCLVLAACGGGLTAEAPLTVPLGLPRDAAERELRAHQFCRRPAEVPLDKEVYPRCDRTNSEWGDAWVTASYDHGKLVELHRWERYADDERAVERWNELIAARAKTSQPVAQMKGELVPGTRAVKAFQGADGTVIGIYLLTPTAPEQANLLERIGYTK